MTPLVRLFETSDDELELALLKSAREDAPGQTGLRDTALALGLTAATAKALADSLAASQAIGHAAHVATHVASTASGLGTSGGASTLASVGGASMATLAKYLAAGALVSFGAMTTVDHAFSPSPKAAQPAAARATRSTERAVASAHVAFAPPSEVPAALPDEPLAVAASGPESAQPKPAALKRKLALDLPAQAADSPPTPDAAPRVVQAEAPPKPSASAAAAAPPSNASLAAEVRLLDRTRAALAAGDAPGARRLLRAYTESGPSAILSNEANLLRVRLLLAEGDRRGAAALARQIIARHPESNHGDSLRSLAAEP